MAATFNPSQMMTLDFYQDNYSEDLSPSSKEIGNILGIELDETTANFVDSMTGEQAYKLLCKILEEKNVQFIITAE